MDAPTREQLDDESLTYIFRQKLTFPDLADLPFWPRMWSVSKRPDGFVSAFLYLSYAAVRLLQTVGQRRTK